jgi:hypothetical protein
MIKAKSSIIDRFSMIDERTRINLTDQLANVKVGFKPLWNELLLNNEKQNHQSWVNSLQVIRELGSTRLIRQLI